MTRSRTPSRQTGAVLSALAAAPADWRYGYELGRQVGLKAGSLYPILIRLADRGLLETRWEAASPSRPPRHLYRLTPAGLDMATTVATQAAAQAARPGASRQSIPRARTLRPGSPEPQLDGA